MATPPITLGQYYVDTHTGFRGLATGHAQYLLSTPQTLLTGPCRATGEPIAEWFADASLHALDAAHLDRSPNLTPADMRAALEAAPLAAPPA
jgi:hypothetical protein